ncbi:MAG: PilZ domain-containing protein [Candidatus Competibacteraceae bacterium]
MSALPTEPEQEPHAEQEKREYHRLRFPFAERPRLIIGKQDYEVVDCSVRGLRYASKRKPLVATGDRVEGILQFRRRTQAPIRGLVVRIQNDEIALYLPDREIPLIILLKEQRYLLDHYPMWS